MRIRMTVTGEKELRKHFDRLGPKAVDVAKDVLLRTVDEILPAIKAKTPVQPQDGGELRESVRRSKPRYAKRTGRVTASLMAGGKLTMEPGKRNIYAWVQEAGEQRVGGRTVRLTHTVGQSPYMAQDVFRAGAKVLGRLKAAADKEFEK